MMLGRAVDGLISGGETGFSIPSCFFLAEVRAKLRSHLL